MRAPLRVPRVSLGKYLQGGAAGRRTTVDALGDSLRAHGVVRVEAHSLEPDGPRLATVAATATTLLGLLEEYFGLDAGRLGALAAGGEPVEGPLAARPEEAPNHLLALFVGPAVESLEVVFAAGSRRPGGARAGELVVFTGEALARVSGGVVPVGSWHLESTPPDGELLVFYALPEAGRELSPLEEFRRRSPGAPASGTSGYRK